MSTFDIDAEYAKARFAPGMTWNEAVKAMQNGSVVRRRSAMFIKVVDSGDDFNDPIIETGTEAMRLHVAVTDEGNFVRVFQGAQSCCLFEPDDDAKNADDWVVVDDKRLW